MFKIVLTTLFSNWMITSATLISENVRKLPPIFKIDPYENCTQYCKCAVKLLPLDSQNPSVYWRTIEETIKDPEYYNHDELFYTICLDNYNFNPDLPPKQSISNLHNEEFNGLGLKANISNLVCNKYDGALKIQKFDLFFMAAFVAYLVFLTYATYMYNGGNEYIMIFSINENWKELRARRKKFDNLKCIQGVRFYTMAGIILCHTFIIFGWGYIENTNYLEEIAQNPIRHGIKNLFTLLVQAFFLISGWLLSYQVFQYWEEKGKIDLKFILLSLINRYFRILPPVLVVTGLASSVWYFRCIKGPIKDVLTDPEYYRCQKNWWANLLFINNHFKPNDMCYMIFWYLAADIQLYTFSLIILATIYFLKKSVERTLLFFIFLSLFICSLNSFFYDVDIIVRITPENIKTMVEENSFQFYMLYTSTHSNMTTYTLGLIFGYVYHKHQKKNILATQARKYLLWFFVMLFPLMAVILSIRRYGTPLRVLLAGLLKPMFALGVGLAILGMSQNNGKFLKKFCENAPVIFLGNISYSTYVIHLFIVVYRVASAKRTLYLSDYTLALAYLKDVTLGFLAGFLMHILLEMPAIKLQKLIIPQIHIKNRKKII